MKKSMTLLLAFILAFQTANAQRIESFTLKDILTGKEFDLSSFSDKRAVVIIFSNMNCPFSKLYEERIAQLSDTFSREGFQFAMVNPHFDAEEGESKNDHEERVKSREFKFPVLDDSDQVVTRMLAASKLPEVVVVTPSQTGFSIAYKGAIDNNPQVAANANVRYLENALNAIMNRRNPSPSSSRAVGCNIRLKSR